MAPPVTVSLSLRSTPSRQRLDSRFQFAGTLRRPRIEEKKSFSMSTFTSLFRSDVPSVKTQVAASTTSLNFRNDADANGVISNTNVSLTKAQVETSVL
jgi:hypothetical protein